MAEAAAAAEGLGLIGYIVMDIWRLSFSFLAASLLFTGPSHRQDSKYVFEQATTRRALVVANSDYENETKLPGTLGTASMLLHDPD